VNTTRHELSLEQEAIYDGRFQPRLPPPTREELAQAQRIRELLGDCAGLTLEQAK
jgi:hypothetical protein